MFAIPHVSERWIRHRDQSQNGRSSIPLILGVKQRGWPRLKCEGLIETRASLLDKREVKSCGVSDCLDALSVTPRDRNGGIWGEGHIRIVQRYRRLVLNHEPSLECRAYVRVSRRFDIVYTSRDRPTPPNSAYCVHRSLSTSSAHKANCRRATSPGDSLPLRDPVCAVAPVDSNDPAESAAPIIPMPFKNERRFMTSCQRRWTSSDADSAPGTGDSRFNLDGRTFFFMPAHLQTVACSSAILLPTTRSRTVYSR